jgi:predicted XRE-type DNA-binding protein
MAGLGPAIHVFRRGNEDVDARAKPAHDMVRCHVSEAQLTMRKKKIRVEEASGNVFADLGLPNPERELLKARLTLKIYKIVKACGLTRAQAGALLGIKHPHVSTLMHNRAGNFSVGRLIEFLTALGQDVEITVKPTRKAQGEMSVVMR